MVDNSRGVVDDRSRGIGRGNGGRGDNRGDGLDNRSGGNNRGNPNHGGRSRNNNRSGSNLDQRGSSQSRGGLLGEDRLALVGDGCVVALRPGGVGDDLDSAVGKVDAVLSSGVGSVPLLGLRENRVA